MEKFVTLKESLAEWQDFDTAQHALAICVGLMSPNMDFHRAKHVFWSANPIGEALHYILQELIKVGVLEHDDEEGKYRWNQAFKGTWEVI